MVQSQVACPETQEAPIAPVGYIIYRAEKKQSDIGSLLARPFACCECLLRNRKLIARLLFREIIGRHKGSLLGTIWWLILPLFMLAVYTFVFSVIFQAKWNIPSGGVGNFAPIFFSGLIVYNVFAESVLRAPNVIFENVSYVKKIVFPVEVLPVVCVGTAIFGGIINLMLLFVLYLSVVGIPPVTALYLPLVLGPLFLTVLGLSWFLSSLGVFLRDLSQLVSVVCSLLMFLSPIFYPVEALPATFRLIVQASPLALVIAQVRSILFWGVVPPVAELGVSWLIACLTAWIGYSWFMLSKGAFADVV
jgi:lipopolysaccharide transport system permease protein